VNSPSPIDSAWPTRLPPGWQTFPDGSIGPANAPSPIDSAWPTRVPDSPYGGYPSNPKPTLPAVGPAQGTSLSTTGNSLSARPATPDDMANISEGEILPPENSTIPNMKSVGPFTGGSATDAIIRGGVRMLPRILRGRIPLADLVTPTDELGGATGVELPRTLGRSPTGPFGRPSMPSSGSPWGSTPEVPEFPGPPLPLRYGPPVDTPATPFTQPQHPSTMRYPGWPSGAAPAPDAVTNRPQDRPSYAGPTVAAPAVPPPRPRPRAQPAVVAQRPNLGNYTPIYQPNIARTGNVRGGRSGDDNAPLMGALDLSRLFQRPAQ
jgi:hypothetical protein